MKTDDTIKINNAQDFLNIVNDIRKDGAVNKSYEQTQDIDFSACDFTPLYSSVHKFKGKYTGKNFKISNITYDPSKNGGLAFSLFSQIDKAGQVSNVIVENLTVSGSGYKLPDKRNSIIYCGGICAENWGTIENCGASGSITTSEQDLDFIMGGICGTNDGQITSCFSDVSLTLTAANIYLGGIAGYNQGGGNIRYCYNHGTIIPAGNVVYAGGIAGRCLAGNADTNNTVSSCYNTGILQAAPALPDICIGGVVGIVSNPELSKVSIDNCYYWDKSVTKGNSYGSPKTTSELTSDDFVTLLNNGQQNFASYTDGKTTVKYTPKINSVFRTVDPSEKQSLYITYIPPVTIKKVETLQNPVTVTWDTTQIVNCTIEKLVYSLDGGKTFTTVNVPSGDTYDITADSVSIQVSVDGRDTLYGKTVKSADANLPVLHIGNVSISYNRHAVSIKPKESGFINKEDVISNKTLAFDYQMKSPAPAYHNYADFEAYLTSADKLTVYKSSDRTQIGTTTCAKTDTETPVSFEVCTDDHYAEGTVTFHAEDTTNNYFVEKEY